MQQRPATPLRELMALPDFGLLFRTRVLVQWPEQEG